MAFFIELFASILMISTIVINFYQIAKLQQLLYINNNLYHIYHLEFTILKVFELSIAYLKLQITLTVFQTNGKVLRTKSANHSFRAS